jgi:hypothetical protein
LYEKIAGEPPAVASNSSTTTEAGLVIPVNVKLVELIVADAVEPANVTLQAACDVASVVRSLLCGAGAPVETVVIVPVTPLGHDPLVTTESEPEILFVDGMLTLLVVFDPIAPDEVIGPVRPDVTPALVVDGVLPPPQPAKLPARTSKTPTDHAVRALFTQAPSDGTPSPKSVRHRRLGPRESERLV